jgi:hypothetical protein
VIRIEDLREAIAECEGIRNPNANTCLKLASLYTILDHKQKKEQIDMDIPSYSYAPQPITAAVGIQYLSDTDFGKTVNGKDEESVMEVMDELMSTLQIMIPRLYEGVLIKLQK